MFNFLGRRKKYKRFSTLEGEQTGDAFGWAVSVSGNGSRMVIGAPYYDDGANTSAGKIYIYHKTSQNTWTLQTSFIGGGLDFMLGYAVSISEDGNTIAAGMPRDTQGGTNRGSVKIYTYTTSWALDATVAQGAPTNNTMFGESVALNSNGTTLAVGAPKFDIAGAGGNDVGAVYINIKSGGSWSEQTRIDNPAPTLGDNFAYSVYLSDNGDTVYIGVPREFTTDAGIAYIYTRSGTTWSLSTTLSNPNNATNDFFGYSIASAETSTLTAVGATQYIMGATGKGKVFLFKNTGSNISHVLTIDGAYMGEAFGYAVSLNNSGTKLAVGIPYNDGYGVKVYKIINEQTDSTSVSAILETTINTPGGNNTGDFGNAVYLDNSGRTLIVGAYDEGKGKVYSYHRR